MKGLRFNGSGMAGIMVASSMLAFCQPAKGWQPKLDPYGYMRPAGALASGSAAPLAPSNQNIPSVLTSSWNKGTCAYQNQNNTITYTDATTGKKSGMVFDIKIKNPQVLLCSDKFTVILTLRFPQRAVVGLGGARIFYGEQDFGSLGGVNGYAGYNSYDFPLVKAAASGIRENTITLNGELLSFKTVSGMTWTTDISDFLAPWKVK